MQFVNPSYEIQSIPDVPTEKSVGQYLERIGRLCYKSEDKITDTSYIPFLSRLWRNKHLAMLEHFIFTLDVSTTIYEDLMDKKWNQEAYFQYANACRYIRCMQLNYQDHNEYLVSGSLTSFFRALEALCRCGYYGQAAIATICQFLTKNFTNIVSLYEGVTVYDDVTYMRDYANLVQNGRSAVKPLSGGYIFDVVSKETLRHTSYAVRWMHDWYTVRFVVDRGITHEIVRHRDASFAQESTRYCNYSKEKYGSEIQFINPCFYPENGTMRQLWEESCANSENSYIEMTQNHCEPAQQARAVLTNSTKSELFMTARIGEWQHFLKMRAANDAHPQMREVAVPLLQEFIEKDPMMFRGVQNWLDRKGKI